MLKKVSLLFVFLLSFCINTFANVTCTTTKHSDNTETIDLRFQLKPNDFVLQESIDISVDHPDVTLSGYVTNVEPVKVKIIKELLQVQISL